MLFMQATKDVKEEVLLTKDELEKMEFRAFKAGISVGEGFLAAALKKARRMKRLQQGKTDSHEQGTLSPSSDPNKVA